MKSNFVYAKDYAEFDSSFLQMHDKNSVDISRFFSGATALPGVYPSALYVNEKFVTNIDLTIKSAEDKSSYPCIDKSILANINFDFSRVPKNLLALSANECIDLSKEISGATVQYDSNESHLNVQIPQIYIKRTSRGAIDPELWDQGITSALLDYNISGYNSESYGRKYQSAYASINTGINIGSWYFRQNGNFSWSNTGESRYTSLNAYVLKDIPDWRSRLMIGQGYTKGRLFDSLPFTGFQVFSEDRMLPSSQRGYAPEIRGIARTTARVVVRQSGQIIYETTVSPGEFLINDLYPTGFGGNLDVTVTEADGSDQYFSVPYTSMADLLRPDSQRFSIVAGQYRNDSLLSNPMFLEGTYQRGISNSFTSYGGFQANPNYYSLQLGSAIGTDIGSFSFDVTQAYTLLPNGYTDLSGQSYQFKYSKNITSTGSNLSLAAYRFSTDGYLDYQTAMQTRDNILRGDNFDKLNRSKNRFIITASQSLPEGWGQFYLSSSFETYWNEDENARQYQAGYNNQYKILRWGFSANRTENDMGTEQTNYALNFSLPLGEVGTNFSPMLRLSMNQDDSGNQRQQVSVTDTFGERNQFNYGVTATHANKDAGSTGDFNLGYVSSVSSLNANYSVGKNYQGQSVGASGSLVAHSGGVTLSPYTGNTYALIEAEGAEGAFISGYSGVQVDSNGYALVPNLSAYEMNTINIDPKGLDNNVELVNTSQKIAPNADAVVLLKYGTKHGSPILINAKNNGKPVPFGSTVFDSDGNSVGMVGQDGQVYARVSQDKGALFISWGDNSNDRCKVNYNINNDKSKNLQKLELDCQN